MTERPTILSPHERRQRAVLDLLLDEHPAHLSLAEVHRATATDPTDPLALDDVDAAIRDLTASGLIHRHDDFLFATRTAVQAWLLDP
jgi:hypothetical protein